MKILHCSTSDRGGGAGIAASRLHVSLLTEGVDSHMAVWDKRSVSPSVSLLRTQPMQKLLGQALPFVERLPLRFYSPPASAGYRTFSWFPYGQAGLLNAMPRDMIHLHWINDGMFSTLGLRKLQGPLVWTLHDCWPFTGGCHYDQACAHHERHCGGCPQLGSTRQHDMSRLCWRIKKYVYSKLAITIVCPSHYMAELAGRSSLLGRSKFMVIPNAVNTNVFRPIDRAVARHILGLEQDAFYLLSGAFGMSTDRRKGGDLLQSALEALRSRGLRFNSLVFGSEVPSCNAQPYSGDRYLGLVHDDVTLALIYSSADIFVCPSREDNLPNTVLEALACGTPVVAFTVGGIPDMVKHSVNGYLAEPFDAIDLARGIRTLLQDTDLLQRMGAAGRDTVERECSMPVVAKRHIALYEEILSEIPQRASKTQEYHA